MLEGCGAVLFYKEVANPRGAITGYKSERKEPPPAHRHKRDQAKQTRGRAKKMKRPRNGMTVLPYVKRPKLRKGIVLFVH